MEGIDAAVVEGPGRKWAIAGPFESCHLSGGQGGIARFLQSFSKGIQRRWDDLGTPRLDEATQARIVELVEAGMAGAAPQEREARVARPSWST